ncbi:ATP-dependent sacrificial sulfur transferase LarE [Veillonella caviae]|uniref:ATP-dependent sacrificial sulfur transferase LarE n=1 Tax=Veillonella caviae TaxID=248316 RepID=UPI002352D691|nr:ATP-dependent sacrificial sulfur transferase LarE [Veillonella caviae]
MELIEYLKELDHIAIALSGGVDSSFLAYAAKQSGIPCKAYVVKSQFVPQFELEDAIQIAKIIDIPLEVIPVNVLNFEEVVSNPSNRCYYCKHHVFSTILEWARRDGFTIIADGTNASDEINNRPGMKALKELSIRSPLRECNLTKTMIRELAHKANLFTWDKPSYACLATRFNNGQKITNADLKNIEKAESYLFLLGLTNFRVRLIGQMAKIQIPECQIDKIIKNRHDILLFFKTMFDDVVLDFEVRE